MATGTKSTASETNAKQGNVFTLSEAELGTLTGTRGRKATDSVYLDEVTKALANATHKTVSEAVEAQAVNGIDLTAGLSPAWVGAQLRKAASQAEANGVKDAKKRITIFARDPESLKANPAMLKAHPHGFVAWVVVSE